jgi:uncharacterized protein with HEPN domain
MRTDRLLLQDILEAIEEVLDATPASRESFDANKLVRSHILRHIQIIGEAAWRLSSMTALLWLKILGQSSRWVS